MLCMVTLLVLLEIPSVLCNPPSKFLSSAFASKQSETVSSSSSHSRASSSSSSNPDDEMLSEVFISLPVPAVSSSSAFIDIMGGESSTKVKHIANSKEFNDILSDEAGKLLVVDFSAAWCMPCKMIAPVFEEMAGEFESSCTFLKVDVDDTPGERNFQSLTNFT